MPGSNEPQPALAESWKSSHGARVYTFTLRPHVEFSNGEPLTAADVVFSMQRVKNLPISVIASFFSSLTDVRATGPLTVEMKFSKPEPELIGLLSLPDFGIVPKHVVETVGEKAFAEHPVGTGPFTVTGVTPGYTKVSMARNPRYWMKGKPYLDGLVYSQVENDNSRLLAVRSGSAQLAIGVPFSQVSTMETTPGVRMVINPLEGAWINPINNTRPPFNDPTVRRALMYATPFKDIISAIAKGYATQANSVVGRMQYWSSAVKPFSYDQAKARSLLAKAGQNNLHVTVQVQGGETNGELLASILQSAWSEVGVHVNIETVSSASLFANLFAGKYEISVIPTESGVNQGYAPDLAVRAYLAGEFFPSVHPSAKLATLIKRATSSTDNATRRRLFQEIQRISYRDEPAWIAVLNLSAFNLASDSLRNFSVLAGLVSRMEEVWLKR